MGPSLVHWFGKKKKKSTFVNYMFRETYTHTIFCKALQYSFQSCHFIPRPGFIHFRLHSFNISLASNSPLWGKKLKDVELANVNNIFQRDWGI